MGHISSQSVSTNVPLPSYIPKCHQSIQVHIRSQPEFLQLKSTFILPFQYRIHSISTYHPKSKLSKNCNLEGVLWFLLHSIQFPLSLANLKFTKTQNLNFSHVHTEKQRITKGFAPQVLNPKSSPTKPLRFVACVASFDVGHYGLGV